MKNMPALDSAFAVTSKDDVKALYAKWASTYDAGFGQAQGYQVPREVVHAFLGAGGTGPVLDVGAGTGLVGEGLKATGVEPVDALDLSPDMIEVARVKDVYRTLTVGDLLADGVLPPDTYASVVSAGTFTLGHVGPEGLAPLLATAMSGGLLVISVNEQHYAAAGFSAAFDDLSSQITDRNDKMIRIFDDRAEAAHRDDLARLLTFRKV